MVVAYAFCSQETKSASIYHRQTQLININHHNILLRTVDLYTRCDQKITFVLNFFKGCLFFYEQLSCPFKINPLRYNIFMSAFFPILETLLKRPFGIANSSCFNFSFISSIVAKRDD